MFKKSTAHHKRGSNPIILLFRLILSLTMLTLLLIGGYSAYKQFSGLDPLKLDPQAVLKQILGARTPQEFANALSSLKINTDFLNKSNNTPDNQENSQAVNQTTTEPTGKVAFKFMLISDTHNDSVNLRKAITQAKSAYPDTAFIIGLGDYTDVGTLEELKKAKNEFDGGGLRYFLVPGDHDLWDCRNRQLPPNCNFREVFGPSYQSFTFNGFRLIMLNNSDNYLGVEQEQLNWLAEQLEAGKNEGSKGIYIFLHEPLFHPSSDHFMGRVTPSLKLQAKTLIYEFKAASVKKVFSGDIHYFSTYEEPETKLSMVTVGAVATERNPQAPRFAIVSVYEDGAMRVEDVELK